MNDLDSKSKECTECSTYCKVCKNPDACDQFIEKIYELKK